MKIKDLFINGKKYTVKGKSKAQLEHMLQLAKDEVRRYEKSIENYPPERMKLYGGPFLKKLHSYVEEIQQALQALDNHEDN